MSKGFLAFTVASIALQTYITSDLYSRVAAVSAERASDQERLLDIDGRLTVVETHALHTKERVELITELSRATNNVALELRGRLLKKQCRRAE